jgi:F-type H+-transporting ATPase subunit a
MGLIHIAENKNLSVLFEWNDLKVYLSETFVSTWVVMALLIVLAIIVRIKLKSFKDVPTGFQNVIEAIVDTIRNFARDTLGKELEALGGYFFGIILFILLSNYSGLLGLRPPTADLATTAPLALSTFLLIHFFGMKMRKAAYFKEYLYPNPIFLPVNVVGELSRPISLGFRLFGNIVGGLIILELIYTMPPILFRFVLPVVLHGYFDLFAGALQTFVFTILSMTFISQKALAE